MHFSIDTAWKPPDSYLHGPNPTYHNCDPRVTGVSHDNQTGKFWPCLDPAIFNPSELDTDQWMEASAALGMKEICITAKHQGGYTMWPSKHTPYGVHASKSFRGGHGDVLRDFVASAKRWGIRVCYYINPLDDGYLAEVANVSAESFMERQKGMLTELLEPGSPYGPVHRLWFDGNGDQRPKAILANYSDYYDSCFELIRQTSPQTLISPYRGDICISTGSLYTNKGPAPNSSDASECGAFSEAGKFFHPTEMHGITMQEGPDGNTDAMPTYWFWHPWACAENISGCPWVGHANASRIFDGYVATVGHGGVLNMNIAPAANGLMNASVVDVMHEAGKAINDTFHLNDAGKAQDVAGRCAEGVATLKVKGQFDFVLSMEDLTHGQRIGNYSIDYKRTGSSTWETLVPPVLPRPPDAALGATDRPDGHDPRDQYIGHRRIDHPIVKTSGAGAVDIEAVRFNCLRLTEPVEPGGSVYLRQFSVHKEIVPWKSDEATPGYPLSAITKPIHGRPRRATSGRFDTESNGEDWHVEPGQTLPLAELRGPGQINHMWFVICGPFCDDRRWARNLVLRIYFDEGAEKNIPSVETPVGDFFAAGHGMHATAHTSLPMAVSSYGRAMNSYWKMPFHRVARVEVTNNGPSSTGVFFQFDWIEGAVPADALLFHARYRQEFSPDSGPAPFTYHGLVNVSGAGSYVGTVLSSVNQLDSWFGEGSDRW